MPILEGLQRGYSNDAPIGFRGRAGEEIPCNFRSGQSVPLRVGVKLEEFDEDKETESWTLCELVGGLM